MTVCKEVLARVLTAFLALAQKDKEMFHPKDIEMVKSNDWWIERFFISNRTEEEATRALIEAMEWRNDYGVLNINEDEFKDIKESGKFSLLGEINKLIIIFSKGLHTYNITDKMGRPVLWNRFTQYKRGFWKKEQSKRFLVYIYELLDQKAGRNRWMMVGDGQDVVKENISLELVYHMVNILEKYYPASLNKMVALDMPQFLLDIGKDLIKIASPELKDVIVFVNGLAQLSEIFNQDQIPAYKLNLYSLPTPKP